MFLTCCTVQKGGLLGFAIMTSRDNRQPKLRNTWIFKYIQYFYITALKSIGRETGAAVSSRTANTRHNLTVTTHEPNATTTTRVSKHLFTFMNTVFTFFFVYNSLSTFFFRGTLLSPWLYPDPGWKPRKLWRVLKQSWTHLQLLTSNILMKWK